jgi:hypothetical protein
MTANAYSLIRVDSDSLEALKKASRRLKKQGVISPNLVDLPRGCSAKKCPPWVVVWWAFVGEHAGDYSRFSDRCRSVACKHDDANWTTMRVPSELHKRMKLSAEAAGVSVPRVVVAAALYASTGAIYQKKPGGGVRVIVGPDDGDHAVRIARQLVSDVMSDLPLASSDSTSQRRRLT